MHINIEYKSSAYCLGTMSLLLTQTNLGSLNFVQALLKQTSLIPKKYICLDQDDV